MLKLKSCEPKSMLRFLKFRLFRSSSVDSVTNVSRFEFANGFSL